MALVDRRKYVFQQNSIREPLRVAFASALFRRLSAFCSPLLNVSLRRAERTSWCSHQSEENFKSSCTKSAPTGTITPADANPHISDPGDRT